MNGTHGNPQKYDSSADNFLGVLYCLCFVLGTPTNILSFVYFIRQKASQSCNKRYVVKLYQLITLNDTLICFLVLPIICVLFDNRQSGVLFSNPMFCGIWGLAWNVLPVIAVFLVAILSFSRTCILMYPLMKLNIKLPLILLLLVSTVLVTEKLAVTFGLEGHSYRYRKRKVVCYISSEDGEETGTNYMVIQTVIFLVVLGIPVIPILASFIMSVYRLKVARKNEARLNSDNNNGKHRKATVTVFIVTAVYIICNIPVLFCHLYFVTYAATTLKDKQKGKTLEKYFIFCYFWNICYALMVALNAAINPAIYLTRMKDYRKFVSRLRSGLALRAFRRV